MPGSDQFNSEMRNVALAIQGHKQAFGRLYEKYADRIFRYLYFRTGSEQEAEDLMAAVFLKAWEALPEINQTGRKLNFKPWLFRIAHNSLIDYYRTNKNEISIEELGQINSSVKKTERIVEAEQEMDQIMRAIKNLDEKSQMVIIGRFDACLSHREIAVVLGIKENHVRVIQYRALDKLRKILGEQK